MAAAYASLVSLLNTLDQIQIHPLLSTSFRNYPNESLREKIDFFLDFVEKYSDVESEFEESEDLVRRIGAAAYEAEDIIEVQAAYLMRSGSTERSLIMPHKLKKIMHDMKSIKEKVIIKNRRITSSLPPATAMVENYSESRDLVRRMAGVALEADEIIQVQLADPISDEQSPSLLPDMQIRKEDQTGSINQQPTSSSSSAAKTTNMVGFDGYLEQLLDQLTRPHSGRKILPIIGMGGIGKTTLARNVYGNLLTVEHFYVRAWVTVSQDFSVSEVLLQALSCLGGSTSKTDKTDGELGEELHKTLYGRRYLIVLDDVWSVKVWDKMKSFFPENNNGSRIVITTRQSELVGYFGSSALAVDFLDDKNSWDLFCGKAFAQKVCPPDLVEIGKNIVNKCKGLPLAIVVIGGFLGKSPRTPEYWGKIANDKSLVLDSREGNKPLSILNLSYKHLPIWLKTCFLYLGLFPEDHRIEVSQLIRLWVASGLIKPIKYQSLEEIAENYVKELVDRNLVLVGDLRVNKKFETCYIHDLVRDLCIKIAEKENCFCVQRNTDGMFHFILDEITATSYPRDSHTSKTPSIFHPLIFFGKRGRSLQLKSRLLRVWMFSDSLDYAFAAVNLRFLSSAFYELPSSISQIWSLQTLIVDTHPTIVAPSEIWNMPQLRHIEIVSIYLPDPPPIDDGSILQNLQTLRVVENLIFTEEVCKRIPNIKDLQIRYDLHKQGGASLCYHLHNVGLLSKLESLRYTCEAWECQGASLRSLKLPSSLKELNLHDCKLVWSDMAMIASLPHLQILVLIGKAVVGAEWNCDEEKFLRLKHLGISGCGDLMKWNTVDTSNFPVLETLSLVGLSNLDEVPPYIGEIPTLESICIGYCSESATISAVKILEEQESLGNQGLQLQLDCYNRAEAETWRVKIEESGFTCQNLRISSILE